MRGTRMNITGIIRTEDCRSDLCGFLKPPRTMRAAAFQD
jgi:hypothetical protein